MMRATLLVGYGKPQRTASSDRANPATRLVAGGVK
jgi:hypothetical protein